MSNFDMKVDILYHLCRRVQKETDMFLTYELMKLKSGICFTINVFSDDQSFKDCEIYTIVDGGYHQEEEFKSAKEHLEKILMEEDNVKKEEINEFMNMTLEQKKAKLIEIIREIPDDSPIHKELYEALKREMEEKND